MSITVEPLDLAGSKWDASAREPIPRLRRTATITINAQVHWGRRERRTKSAPGPDDNSDGFLVFLTEDMTAAAFDPKPGDRVATIEGETVNLYFLTAGQRRGQYGGGYGQIRVHFEDRRPRQD